MTMTPKIFKKNALNKIIQKWMKAYDVVAPVSSKEGIHFRSISDPKEIVISKPRKTVYPPKNVFLPQSEVLFNIEDGSYAVPEDAPRQRIIFGMRPCDARAVWLLDTIFNQAEDFDLYWGKKREKALIISLGCASLCEAGFCDTVGSGPFGKEGSDILITELDDVYFLQPLTKAGEKLASSMKEADSEQIKQKRAIHRNSKVKDHQRADLPAVRDKLYASFDTPI